MQTREEFLTILDGQLQDVLTHAALFQQYVRDGRYTPIVQDEYGHMRDHLARLIRNLLLEARRLDERCVLLQEELQEARESRLT